MSNKIDYKQPSDEQLKIMQEYANICSEAMAIILKCKSNLAIQNATSRIQESMMWFHSFIVNGGELLSDMPANQEVLQTGTPADGASCTVN